MGVVASTVWVEVTAAWSYDVGKKATLIVPPLRRRLLAGIEMPSASISPSTVVYSNVRTLVETEVYLATAAFVPIVIVRVGLPVTTASKFRWGRRGSTNLTSTEIVSPSLYTPSAPGSEVKLTEPGSMAICAEAEGASQAPATIMTIAARPINAPGMPRKICRFIMPISPLGFP